MDTASAVQGDTVQISFESNVAGTPTDPGTLTLYITDGQGANTSYVYGVGMTIVKDGTGLYHALISMINSGTWSYRWVATGAVARSVQGQIQVAAPFSGS